jgi:hypothetical protein
MFSAKPSIGKLILIGVGSKLNLWCAECAANRKPLARELFTSEAELAITTFGWVSYLEARIGGVCKTF